MPWARLKSEEQVVQNLGRSRPPSYTKWADIQLNDDDDDGDISSIIYVVRQLGQNPNFGQFFLEGSPKGKFPYANC